MPVLQFHMHSSLAHHTIQPDDALLLQLEQRRQHLLTLLDEMTGLLSSEAEREACAWKLRSYPVLSILAPAVSSGQGNVEYPGDPMCLYAALSVAIDQVVKARALGLSSELADHFKHGYTYTDLCPQWGRLPSRDYRLQVSDSGVRDYTHPERNTDQTVFDPRVWNEDVQRYLEEQLLPTLQPRVVLISCVSPAHRYALALAQQIRRVLPQALIVLGGRHIDETMRLREQSGELHLSQSSTLSVIADGRVNPVVDFLISGDGYFALDWLMKAISLAMTIPEKSVTVAEVIRCLDLLAPCMGSVPGRAILAAIEAEQVHIFPLRGPRVDLARLPSPYQAMAIRARFPIFRTERGQIARTAHMMTTSACPYQCNFCSEGRAVVGQGHRFASDPVVSAIQRVLEYVSYGAEALFFDDSVFWGGNLRHLSAFSRALAQAKEEARGDKTECFPLLQEAKDLRRLRQLQWGAQFTAEFLTTLFPRPQILECLKIMKEAGCSYLYVGIESLAATVMQSVHKNLNREKERSWAQKVRQALEVAQEAGIRVGSSVLFGLDGETRETIEVTIEGVGQLIDDGLLMLASPNILTYHPATPITHMHGKEEQLDYHSLGLLDRPPYSYFEEAFPGVVSRELSEDDIWYIHLRTRERWGQRRYSDSLPSFGSRAL